MKNCIRPHYEKLKLLKSGFIENLIFENNRDPWIMPTTNDLVDHKVEVFKPPLMSNTIM